MNVLVNINTMKKPLKQLLKTDIFCVVWQLDSYDRYRNRLESSFYNSLKQTINLVELYNNYTYLL